MFKSFESFTYSSKENFPMKECIIQNAREPNVFESDNIYQILYIDIRFSNCKMVTYAKPYICYDENKDVTFGWISDRTSEIFGNVENSCQFWDEFVIGFIRINEEDMHDDEKLFDSYKSTIESQYE